MLLGIAVAIWGKLLLAGETRMGPIVVCCPVTGAEFEVGIETDRESFATLPDVTSTAHCPHCGATHEWSPAKAWLRVFGRTRAIVRQDKARLQPVSPVACHEPA
jgi:hypothetical protein